jgi:hypothetical protein
MQVIDFKEILVEGWNAFALGRIRHYKGLVEVQA